MPNAAAACWLPQNQALHEGEQEDLAPLVRRSSMALWASGASSKGQEAPTTIFRLPFRRRPEMASLAPAAVPGRIQGPP